MAQVSAISGCSTSPVDKVSLFTSSSNAKDEKAKKINCIHEANQNLAYMGTPTIGGLLGGQSSTASASVL